MPAAAVIPAPIAYIKVVAGKKLVVGSLCERHGLPTMGVTSARRESPLYRVPPCVALCPSPGAAAAR